MIQLFLRQMVPAMEQGVMLTVPLAILLALISSLPEAGLRRKFWRAMKWGVFVSLFFAVVKTGTRQAVSREGFEGVAIFASLLSEISLLALLARPAAAAARMRIIGVTSVVLVISLWAYHGLELWLMPVSIAISATGEFFTLDVLAKSLGYGAGLLLGFLSGYLVYKASAALFYGRLLFVYAVQVAGCIVQQGIYLIQILMIRHIVSGAALMSVMAPLIDNQRLVIFLIFFVTLVVPVTQFLQPRPVRPADANPAQYRKLLAAAKHKLRWGSGVVAALFVMVLLSSAGYSFANKKEELVPAVPIQAENGYVRVPLEDVGDGHLHRYVYRTENSTMVRFIIIKKGGSAYGVGLDACEVCGPTGYYERDDQVICKLCDVIMNKATIGMPGGCNPVPVKYDVDSGTIRIESSILEKEAKRFR